MLTRANHFGHRDTDGIVVDLFGATATSRTNSASRSRTGAREPASFSTH
jgi:hypothetical protein